jgi:hypothetical protein
LLAKPAPSPAASNSALAGLSALVYTFRHALPHSIAGLFSPIRQDASLIPSQSIMNFVHPETTEMLLSMVFFLAKTLRRQEFTGLAPLRPSRLRREKEFPSKWRPRGAHFHGSCRQVSLALGKDFAFND